jgi:hypothetical protein
MTAGRSETASESCPEGVSAVGRREANDHFKMKNEEKAWILDVWRMSFVRA